MNLPMLLLAAALQLPGFAPRTPPDDAALRVEVTRALQGCPAFTVFDEVTVQVSGGAVTLEGRVTKVSKREEIEGTVARVPGVRSVRNQLAVLAPSPTDDDLRRQLARSIYGNPSFWHYAVMPHPPIHIIVEHGHVTLAGHVRSESDRALAKALAEQAGAAAVADRLTTRTDMLEARDQSH